LFCPAGRKSHRAPSACTSWCFCRPPSLPQPVSQPPAAILLASLRTKPSPTTDLPFPPRPLTSSIPRLNSFPPFFFSPLTYPPTLNRVSVPEYNTSSSSWGLPPRTLPAMVSPSRPRTRRKVPPSQVCALSSCLLHCTSLSSSISVTHRHHPYHCVSWPRLYRRCCRRCYHFGHQRRRGIHEAPHHVVIPPSPSSLRRLRLFYRSFPRLFPTYRP
jgi:hypothetical protein